MSEEQSPDFPEYDAKTTPVWDTLAEWWDDTIEDANGRKRTSSVPGLPDRTFPGTPA